MNNKILRQIENMKKQTFGVEIEMAELKEKEPSKLQQNASAGQIRYDMREDATTHGVARTNKIENGA